jgi:ribokinase
MTEPAPIFVLGSFVAACSAKVARLPSPGESQAAEAFTLEAGGKGFNLAVGARRLGADVDGLLAIGDDLFAQIAAPALARAGLPESMLRRFDGPTGSGVGFTDARGENCLAVFPGANLRLSAAEVRDVADAVRQAELVLAQFEIGDAPIVEAFELAHMIGVKTLLNPSPFRAIDPKILTHCTILVLNRVEALAALGLKEERVGPEAMRDHAAQLMALGPEVVVVTLGADGALLCRRDAAPLYQPAFRVETVDTLGAGDAFAAGLAVSLVDGHGWALALRRAAACGALATRRLGVFDALPTREELENFLKP